MTNKEYLTLLVCILPIIASPVSLLFGKIHGKIRDYFSTLVALITFIFTLLLFPSVLQHTIRFDLPLVIGWTTSIHLDILALTIVSLISFLSLLATLYSIGYMEPKRLNRYYSFLLLFLGTMNGVVIAGDLFTMFIFWELMTLSAFFLVIFHDDLPSIRAGIKYFLLSEMGALCMLISICFIFFSYGTVDMVSLMNAKLYLNSGFMHFVLFLFLIGVGVKAGMFPLHSWLPDAHPAAPSPVSAILSGVMIKVGIYLMFRVFWQIFALTFSWNIVLCALGSITILIGVMMAMVQHDAKRLLAYHSVSQIGYMILGIGTGVGIGIAGALFHLINHAIFKGLLFLCMGGVILRLQTRDLDEYGGLFKMMPITFITCLIASLSISGIPPLNGFFSKWMIYQGIIEAGEQGLSLWAIWLIAALFGSVLTLASFVKLIHATFFGRSKSEKKVQEVSASMSIPLIILALICVIFGIFPYKIPLKLLILPTVSGVNFIGIWQPELATILIIVGIVLGFIIYGVSRVSARGGSAFGGKARVTKEFIGGEEVTPDMKVSGTDFYLTIQEMPFFGKIYEWARKGFFDIYEILKTWVFFFTKIFKAVHCGSLPFYLLWMILGLAIILLITSL